MKRSDPAPSSVAFDWTMGILAVVLIAGIIQDGWAHNHGKVDESFFTPWHAMLYGGMALNGIVLGVVGVGNLMRGRSFRDGLPYGYWLSLIGVFLFALGGGLDLLWHDAFGIEADLDALVSPTHLTLAFAAALVCSGPVRSVAHRYDASVGGWLAVGPAVLGLTAILGLVGFFTQYAQPIGDTAIESAIAKSDEAQPVQGIYSMRADGSDQRRIFVTADQDIYAPAVSPDGTRLAYRVAEAGKPASDIFVSQLDGSGATRITHSGRHDTQPAWSWDGRWIAFVSAPAGTSGDFGLRAVRPDGSGLKTIDSGVTMISLPSWSPDGRTIAVGSRSGTTDEIELFPVTQDADRAGAPSWLASTADGTGPAWSPDGATIAFEHEDPMGGSAAAIALASVGGAGADAAARTIAAGDVSDPAWSSDGKRLAFVRVERGDAQVFVADADGAGAVDVSKLTAFDAGRPAWSPGGRIYFAASGRGSASQSSYAQALALCAMLVQAIVVAGATLMVVRRWRAPVGAITVMVGLFALGMATQKDEYSLVLAAVAAGVLGDLVVAWMGGRARSGPVFHALGAAVPLTLTATFIALVGHDRGIGWSTNLAIGAPAIAAIAGLLIAFAYDPPLREAGSVR